MLDKKSILEALDIEQKTNIFAAHQNMGKSTFAEKLSEAIEKGQFDAKIEESKNEENVLPV